MKARKVTPVVPPPPVTVFLELTQDEYKVLQEASYTLFDVLRADGYRQPDHIKLTGTESAAKIAERLYNEFPSVRHLTEKD